MILYSLRLNNLLFANKTVIIYPYRVWRCIMKIAIPAQGANVNQHFGRSESFAIFELTDGTAKLDKIVSATGFQHQHAKLADLLKEENVTVLIAGGIGSGAIAPLKEIGIEVLTGATGELEAVALQYAKGEFVSNTSVCNHHHEDGHHHH